MGKSAYEPFFADKKVDSRFPYQAPFEHELVSDKDRLCEILFGISYDTYIGYVENDINDERVVPRVSVCAFDTETSGLNPAKNHLVGFSLCFAGENFKGYYIPVKHLFGEDLQIGVEAIDIVWHYLLKCKLVYMFNVRFDLRMLEFHNPPKYKHDWNKISEYEGEGIFKSEGYVSRFEYYNVWDIKYFDIMVPLWMSDTNLADNEVVVINEGGVQASQTSLKRQALRFLGWEQPTFKETLGGNDNFYEVHPMDALVYASCDAITTLNLAERAVEFHKSFLYSAKINQRIPLIMNEFEDRNMRVDIERAEEMRRELERSVEKEKDVLFSIGGYFNYNSGKQVEMVFFELGLDTGYRTKTGSMQCNAEALEELLDTELSDTQRRFLDAFMFVRKNEKFVNDFVTNLIYHADEYGGVRFNYNTCRVATGRLSSSAERNNDYFSDKFSNCQQIPKPRTCDYFIREVVDGDPDDESNILGWRIDRDYKRLSELAPVNHKIEAFDDRNNVRKVFYPDEGQMWCSIDFKGQELRIIANLSKEPLWVNTFKDGGDLHAKMAEVLCEVRGVEYSREERSRAKSLNFLFVYGGTESTFARKERLSDKVAHNIFKAYKDSIPRVLAWQNRVISYGKKHGTIYNYLGMPRRVKYWLENSNEALRGFGYRTCNNNPVQSLGADIMKLALIKAYAKIVSDRERNVRLLLTVHDEINFGVDKRTVERDVIELAKLMTIRLEGHEVPYEVDVEIGHSWGRGIKVRVVNGERLIPAWEELTDKEKLELGSVEYAVDGDDDTDIHNERIDIVESMEVIKLW